MTLENALDEVLASQQKTIQRLRKRLEELEREKAINETQTEPPAKETLSE